MIATRRHFEDALAALDGRERGAVYACFTRRLSFEHVRRMVPDEGSFRRVTHVLMLAAMAHTSPRRAKKEALVVS